jgi:hypothetical protein
MPNKIMHKDKAERFLLVSRGIVRDGLVQTYLQSACEVFLLGDIKHETCQTPRFL